MSLNGGIEIREARKEDLAGIFQIYNYEILNSTATFDQIPKTVVEQEEFFNQHDKLIYPIFVAERKAEKKDSTEIVGWGRLRPWSSRPSYSITSDFSIYVDSGHKGSGIGKLLLDKLIQHARTVNIRTLIAVITDENQGSIRFHEKAGFETVGILKQVGLKFGRLLDVRFMQLNV